ncbi:Uncharacterised protein [uncultured Clostridium sp.]|uniref:hypothetical protein n=1 Tax=uncultured Clostridium sp. TaxID=59620 RepID=UPI00082132A3|nr:hypothetical protein [uncultured Clostridium sp.]SCK04432.1 Uncharacterised protein [uncultured Clostridium sp.]
MKVLTSLITASFLLFNRMISNNTKDNYPKLIDAFELAYDAIYNGDNGPEKDFIILDMESFYFLDTTYEEKMKLIEHFKKYGQKVLNASSVKLKEIDLIDENGTIIIDGDLLMMTNVYSKGEGNLVIEGEKYHSPVAAYLYRITLKRDKGPWEIEKIEDLGVA